MVAKIIASGRLTAVFVWKQYHISRLLQAYSLQLLCCFLWHNKRFGPPMPKAWNATVVDPKSKKPGKPQH